MHFARLVKQACVDLVSDLFVYYRLGCELFVCSWGLHLKRHPSITMHSNGDGDADAADQRGNNESKELAEMF